MTFGSSIGPVVFVPLLTFMIVAVGWRSAFALLGGIGALWVVIWLVVARERLADRSAPVHETHGARRRTRWSQVLPLIFSRNIIFSIFAAFSIYCAGCNAGSESRVCPGCRSGFLYAARFHCSPCDRGDDSGDRKPGRRGIAQRILVGRAVAPGRWRVFYGICAAG